MELDGRRKRDGKRTRNVTRAGTAPESLQQGYSLAPPPFKQPARAGTKHKPARCNGGRYFHIKGLSMRRIYLASTLLLAAMAFGSASAAPAQYEKGLSSDSAIIKVQDHRRQARPHARPHARPRPAYRPHYRAGGHYRSAPHGWRRYHARPGDWRTRGCILVGPVWFCP